MNWLLISIKDSRRGVIEPGKVNPKQTLGGLRKEQEWTQETGKEGSVFKMGIKLFQRYNFNTWL